MKRALMLLFASIVLMGSSDCSESSSRNRVDVNAHPAGGATTPVPEPGSMLLFAVGLGAVLWYMRKKI